LTGQIAGSVQDPSGSPVPDAVVALAETARTQARETRSGPTGDFIFTQLLPGAYKLVVTATGFRKFERSEIQLSATERVVLPAIQLQLGEVTQTITVEAEAARLQTQSAERSGLVNTFQMQQIPMKGRDYLGMVRLLPGVVDTANREAPDRSCSSPTGRLPLDRAWPVIQAPGRSTPSPPSVPSPPAAASPSRA